MVGRDTSSDLAVHLLGPRTVHIVRAQSCLDMTYRNLLIECGQSGSRGGRRVAVYQHYVRLCFAEDIAHACKYPRRNIIEVLSLFHDVQVVVGYDSENGEYLIEHLPVLPRYAYDRSESFAVLLKLFHQRGHLYRFRTCPENKHDFFHDENFRVESMPSVRNYNFTLTR